VIGSFGMSEKRNRIIDFPYTTAVTAMALMIPKPSVKKTNHLYAICKPFEPEVNASIRFSFFRQDLYFINVDHLKVWLLILFALIIGVASLYAVTRIVSRMLDLKGIKKAMNKDITSEYTRFRKALSYIFGLIVVQG